jgi:hypothetical protein
MKEYMTMQGTYHLDAHLTITQQVYEKIHGYATDSSLWRVPYRWATHWWKNIWLCKGHTILMHTLQSRNRFMKKYMTMPRTHHCEGCLTSGQHIGERIYDYAREVSSWCTPYNHATGLWKNTWLCHRLIILKGALQVGNTFMKDNRTFHPL